MMDKDFGALDLCGNCGVVLPMGRQPRETRTPIAIAIGAALKREIDRCGWTVVQLADAIGVDRSMIYKIIRGDAALTLERAHEIAQLLGTSPINFVAPPQAA